MAREIKFRAWDEKNGKDVYEGDVDETRCVCIWDEANFKYAWKDLDDGFISSFGYMDWDINIVGTIHEVK